MITAIVCTLLATQTPAPVSLKPVKTYPTLKAIAYAAPKTGSLYAASLETPEIRIMDAAKGTTVFSLKGHPQPVYGLAFNPAGTVLATGDETARLYLWDVKTGKKIKEFVREPKGHTRGIYGISFSVDGKLIATTGRDDVILVREVASSKTIAKILGNAANVVGATFSPAGGRLYAATLGNGIRAYNTKNFQAAAGMDGTNPFGFGSFAVNAAGTRAVAGCRDNSAVLFDLKANKRLNSLRGHQDWVASAVFAPNGKYVATSSNDRKVILFDVNTYKPAATLEAQSAVGAPLVFTGDGKFLLSTNDMDQMQVTAVTPPQAAAK